MKNLLKNKIGEKVFYWISALLILIAVPSITIFILRLGMIFNPLGLIIKLAIYIFCGSVTLVGFIAMILFFYESCINEIKKRKKNKY